MPEWAIAFIFINTISNNSNNNKMKINKIFLVATIFFAMSSNAQITKGNWLMGGSGSLSNYKDTFNGIRQEGTNFSLFPNIGYFFVDNLSAGALMQVSFSSSYSGTVYGLSPFIRYYFLDTDKSINVFSEVSYGFQKQTSTNSNFEKFNIKAGTVFFLNNTIGLELALNYSQSKTSFDNQNRTISFVAGFQIHLERN